MIPPATTPRSRPMAILRDRAKGLRRRRGQAEAGRVVREPGRGAVAADVSVCEGRGGRIGKGPIRRVHGPKRVGDRGVAAELVLLVVGLGAGEGGVRNDFGTEAGKRADWYCRLSGARVGSWAVQKRASRSAYEIWSGSYATRTVSMWSPMSS